ncbi:MAG: hypothetical protein ACHBN1_06860 [Heteroscytonema crispum UTEX LB 1556]
MKIFASQTQNRQKIFFGDADSFTLIRQQIPKDVLLREIKLACLLYDHVVLAAAYFWQSRTMYSLLPYVEPLIQHGDLLPAIRDYSQTVNADDYLERRIEESSVVVNQSPISKIPSLASEIAKPTQRPIANELNNIGTFFHIDTGSIEVIYRRLWLNDIFDSENPKSLHSLMVISIPHKYHAWLKHSLQIIGKRQYFSRSLIASCILELQIPRETKIIFIERASELYLLSNAIAVNGDLLTNARYGNIFSNYRGKSFGSLARANVDIFQKVLSFCELPISSLDEMSSRDILNLKYSEEFIAFRRLYFNLINQAKSTEKDIANEIIQHFSNLKKMENRSKNLVRLLSILEGISSGVFVNTLSSVLIPGFSPVAPPIILGSGITASISHFLKKIKKIQNTPLLNFISFIVEERYRSQLHSHILQLKSNLK